MEMSLVQCCCSIAVVSVVVGDFVTVVVNGVVVVLVVAVDAVGADCTEGLESLVIFMSCNVVVLLLLVCLL